MGFIALGTWDPLQDVPQLCICTDLGSNQCAADEGPVANRGNGGDKVGHDVGGD